MSNVAAGWTVDRNISLAVVCVEVVFAVIQSAADEWRRRLSLAPKSLPLVAPAPHARSPLPGVMTPQPNLFATKLVVPPPTTTTNVVTIATVPVTVSLPLSHRRAPVMKQQLHVVSIVVAICHVVWAVDPTAALGVLRPSTMFFLLNLVLVCIMCAYAVVTQAVFAAALTAMSSSPSRWPFKVGIGVAMVNLLLCGVQPFVADYSTYPGYWYAGQSIMWMISAGLFIIINIVCVILVRIAFRRLERGNTTTITAITIAAVDGGHAAMTATIPATPGPVVIQSGGGNDSGSSGGGGVEVTTRPTTTAIVAPTVITVQPVATSNNTIATTTTTTAATASVMPTSTLHATTATAAAGSGGITRAITRNAAFDPALFQAALRRLYRFSFFGITLLLISEINTVFSFLTRYGHPTTYRLSVDPTIYNFSLPFPLTVAGAFVIIWYAWTPIPWPRKCCRGIGSSGDGRINGSHHARVASIPMTGRGAPTTTTAVVAPVPTSAPSA